MIMIKKRDFNTEIEKSLKNEKEWGLIEVEKKTSWLSSLFWEKNLSLFSPEIVNKKTDGWKCLRGEKFRESKFPSLRKKNWKRKKLKNWKLEFQKISK